MCIRCHKHTQYYHRLHSSADLRLLKGIWLWNKSKLVLWSGTGKELYSSPLLIMSHTYSTVRWRHAVIKMPDSSKSSNMRLRFSGPAFFHRSAHLDSPSSSPVALSWEKSAGLLTAPLSSLYQMIDQLFCQVVVMWVKTWATSFLKWSTSSAVIHRSESMVRESNRSSRWQTVAPICLRELFPSIETRAKNSKFGSSWSL